MAVLAFYHPWLLGFDIILLASIGFIIFVLGRGAVPSAIKESKHKYYMAAWLEDIARCPATFRNDGGTELPQNALTGSLTSICQRESRHFRVLMRQIVFALELQAVASTVLLGLGGWLVISGELTLGQLVAAELIVTVIVGASPSWASIWRASTTCWRRLTSWGSSSISGPSDKAACWEPASKGHSTSRSTRCRTPGPASRPASKPFRRRHRKVRAWRSRARPGPGRVRLSI